MTTTIDFMGICTHLPMPPDHRVVLVNGTSGLRVDGDIRVAGEQKPIAIPPHLATIEFCKGEFKGTFGGIPIELGRKYPLTGLHVHQRENFDLPLLYSRSWSDMPKLTRHAQAFSWSLSRDVTEYGRVSAYIEVRGGTFGTKTEATGMVYAQLQIEEPAQLEFMRIWNGKSIGVIEPRKDAHIIIRNEPETPAGETDLDFLLHYRIFEALPFQITPPKSTGLPGPSAGCSNSLYP
jgi:hypothetical protein